MVNVSRNDKVHQISWGEFAKTDSKHIYTFELLGDAAVLAVEDGSKKTAEDIGQEIVEYITSN